MWGPQYEEHALQCTNENFFCKVTSIKINRGGEGQHIMSMKMMLQQYIYDQTLQLYGSWLLMVGA